MSGVASLRQGEWYQDLYAWLRMLDLQPSGRLARVDIESSTGAHVDDVVAYPRDPAKPIEFVQLKFHVGTEADRYDTAFFTKPPATAVRAAREGKPSRATTPLQKFWKSWQQVRADGRRVQLVLKSNWSWDNDDPLAALVSGYDEQFREAFLAEPDDTRIGQARESWRTHLGATPDDFRAFMGDFHFKLGTGSARQLREDVATRMHDQGLESDDAAVLRAVGQVGEWIRCGIETITPDLLQQTLVSLRLFRTNAEPAVRVDLCSIERQARVDAADHTIDWCEHFEATPDASAPRGYRLQEGRDWQRDLLAELVTLKQQLNAAPTRVLRVQGQARLSAWTAFGHVFDQRAGYTIVTMDREIEWRTDAPMDARPALLCTSLSSTDPADTLAVTVAITNGVVPAVRRYDVARRERFGAWLEVQPISGPSPAALDSPSAMVSMATQIRAAISDAVAQTGARTVHLFYSGPRTLALALGHRMGAAAPRLQLYEYHPVDGYLPSFLLSA
jgi:hypothetical protein